MNETQELERCYEGLLKTISTHSGGADILIKAHLITTSLTDLELENSQSENVELVRKIKALKRVSKQLSEMEIKH